jgi:hypothetical protein
MLRHNYLFRNRQYSHLVKKSSASLWTLNVHRRVNNIPPPIPVLRLVNPIHNFLLSSLTIILILSYHLPLRISSRPTSSVLTLKLHAFLISVAFCCAAHTILFDLVILVVLGQDS